ncbi:MAG TPA: glycosyltransferase WbuB, partial [Thermoanaerobaculia bacterium]
MRVVFVNRYFYPDHSATSQMLADLAFHLASRGWDVGVITSRLRYDDASARLPARERVQQVDVRRIWTTRFGRGSLLGRAFD